MEERGPSAPGQRGQTQEGPGHSEADCPETEAPLPGGRVRNHNAGSMRVACWISGRRDEAGRRRRHRLTGIAIQGSGTGAAEPGRAAVWKVKLDDISPVAFGARNEASELGGKAGERILFWTEYWRGAGRRAGGGRSRPRQEARWPGGRGDQNAGDGGSERMTTPWEEGLGERGAFQKSRRATRSCDF